MGTLLDMRGIGKCFPGVRALWDVNFQLEEGEIHALMGENGAGKSTLIKVLTGVYIKDEGQIYLQDQLYEPKSPQDAQGVGISTVYQEVNLCENLSVAENIMIGKEVRKGGLIQWKPIEERAKSLLERLDIHIDVTKPLGYYSIAIQQMVAIARALSIDAKVLILDEPTSSLDEGEVQQLFNVMKGLKAEGIGIIFVTHFLEQVYSISDRITVLRNGGYVGTYVTHELPRLELVGKMLGKALDEFKGQNKEASGKVHDEAFIRGNGLVSKSLGHPVELSIYKGEVLGFAGLLGAGRTEAARLLFGADAIESGELKKHEKSIRLKAPIDAMKQGIGLCPEDRKLEGIIGDLTVAENIILALQAKKGWYKPLSREEQQSFAEEYIKALNIKTPDTKQYIKNLSGGNQQKVILARWLLTHPELLILDEPTRGIDVGTKVEIQKLVIKLASENMAIVFISSELEEMVRCCQRIMVFRDHQVVGQLEDADISEENIMKTIAGGDTDEKVC